MGDFGLKIEGGGDDAGDVRYDTGYCICGAGSGSSMSQSALVSTSDS